MYEARVLTTHPGTDNIKVSYKGKGQVFPVKAMKAYGEAEE
jgi:hypothetical protein